MSLSPSKKNKFQQAANISAELKGKCVEYVLEHLREDLSLYQLENFSSRISEEIDEETGKPVVEFENEEERDALMIDSTDKFLLLGHTQSGQRVLEHIATKAKNFSSLEKEILREWRQKAVNSIFEILAAGNNYLELLDMVAEVKYKVYLNREISPREFFPDLEIGAFISTTIAPTQKIWFFSGNQLIIPKYKEREIFEKIIQGSYAHPRSIYRNNPEKLNTAFRLQKEQYDFFVEFFGTNEVIVPGNMIRQKETEYYQAWHKKKGPPWKPPQFPIIPEIEEAESVGILMDEKEGLHFAIDYAPFKNLFFNPDNLPPDWQSLLYGYLEDEGIPAFAFERMKDRYPEGFKKILKTAGVLEDKKNFDPIEDFEMIMDRYKPEWRETYPSIHPVNERFRHCFYQQEKMGRNEPCPCGSGKKYKKCHGK